MIVVVLASVFIGACLPAFPANKEIDPGALARLLMDSRLYIFVTAKTPGGGNLQSWGGATYANGIAGADAFCMQQYPLVSPTLPAGIYKALLIDYVNRNACVNANCSPADPADRKDWVLIPNANYYLAGGTPVLTTNQSSIVDFTTSALLTPFATSGSWYTGLLANWVGFPTSVIQNCSRWTDGVGGAGGEGGNSGQTGSTAVQGYIATVRCDGTNNTSLLCVRQ